MQTHEIFYPPDNKKEYSDQNIIEAITFISGHLHQFSSGMHGILKTARFTRGLSSLLFPALTLASSSFRTIYQKKKKKPEKKFYG